MRPHKLLVALAVVPAFALSACQFEIGDQDAIGNVTVTNPDGSTTELQNIQVNGNRATAQTSDGRKVSFTKPDGGDWQLAEAR